MKTPPASSLRRMLAPGGTVLIADERVGDEFTGEGDEAEQLMYGFSILHCLPQAMAYPNAAGTGTIMTSSMLRNYAAEAGFSDVEVLPIEGSWRFYRLISQVQTS